MDQKLESAINDVALIKKVLEKTQRDFSKVSVYFIGIGILHLTAWLLEEISYFIRNRYGYGYSTASSFWWGGRILLMAGYGVLFFYFMKKAKMTGNEICESMVKVWMVVLIGSGILGWLYMVLLPSGNSDKVTVLWRCRELIEVLPVIFALFMTGIMTRRRPVTVFTAIYSIFYFVMFVSMKEVPYGTWGGVGTLSSASGVCMQYLMSIGMIVLGIYLKWNRKETNILKDFEVDYGNKCDT